MREISNMHLEMSRRHLVQWHADTLAEIHKFGITGSNYGEVCLHFEAVVSSELARPVSKKTHAKSKGQTDGALLAFGELLDSIEQTIDALRSDDLPRAILSAVLMAPKAHALRGRVILRENSAQRKRAQASSVESKNRNRNPLRQKVREFRAARAAKPINHCYVQWKRLHKRSRISLQTFYEYCQ